ncbi:MAG TPA: BON domain-containing protein [Marinagarivorans sp.]
MKFSSKLILPLTFSSILAANTALAKDDMEDAVDNAEHNTEQTYEKAKENTKDAWKDTKEGTKDVWADVKEGSKKAWKNTEDAYKDGVIAGKLETALILNEHLNPFEIDIDVDNGDVLLEGDVESEIEKDLASNIAEGINGVSSVDNQINIEKDSKKDREEISEGKNRDFFQYIADASTTASIKTELLADGDVSGLDINVDTYKDRVVLSGKVKTEAQKTLAEKIVKKRDNVTHVVNNLTVNSQV